MSETSFPTTYQLKAVLLGINPMISRRFLVPCDCTITDLHNILQITMGWSDDYLDRFRIHGIQYGLYHEGGVRLFEVLRSQGMQMNQQDIFLSDGAETVCDLQLHLKPKAEHILDWFHISMRIPVMSLMAKGLGPPGSKLRESVLRELERVKWYLWNGNVMAIDSVAGSLIIFLLKIPLRSTKN